MMRIKILGVVILLFVSITVGSAQQIIMGTNNYVEYQVGTLPIVISVPHGGDLEPLSILNRTCNSAVNATDVFTIETALEIKNALFAITGCYPHLIISHLKRNKLDPNRNLTDGACGNTFAATAWNEFHSFITTARNAANLQFSSKTFFVDLHGHGNPIQRIELGYLLYDNELALADNILNSNQYINFSSIKNLVASNINNYTHAELLKGQKSFGTLLANRNFPSVPSQSIPFPGTTTNYFSGGYITANHTCYTSSVNINGLQMELNYTGIRNNSSNRTQFAIAFSEAIIEYLNTHFNMVWNLCTPLPISLTYFTATPQDNKVLMQWQTATETNNAFFNVQKSNNSNNWETVVTIKGSGNSSILKTYNAIDSKPFNGINYYRIKQTDNNGNYTFSAIRNVELGIRNSGINIYPNPAKDIVNISCKDGIKEVKIINELGKVIYSKGFFQSLSFAGFGEAVNTKQFPKGIYIVQLITSKGNVLNEKLVIE